MKILKLTLAFFIPIFLNNLINLSEGFYLNHVQRYVIDLFVIFGVMGIILIQTYGAYRILDFINIKKS